MDLLQRLIISTIVGGFSSFFLGGGDATFLKQVKFY